jgi:hypothetical protein
MQRIWREHEPVDTAVATTDNAVTPWSTQDSGITDVSESSDIEQRGWNQGNLMHEMRLS